MGNKVAPCEIPGKPGTRKGSCPTHDKNTGRPFRDPKMCYDGCDMLVCTASTEYPEAHYFCKHGHIWGSRSVSKDSPP